MILLNSPLPGSTHEKLDFCCVVDVDGMLCGILTRSDLLRAIELAVKLPKSDYPELKVADIMMRDPIALTGDESTTLAILTMREHGFKRIPIIESSSKKRLVGYIRIENLMDSIHRRLTAKDRITTATAKAATREFNPRDFKN